MSTSAEKRILPNRASTTTCRGSCLLRRRTRPVWASVRGAAVKAVSPAKRGAATRLDGGEHTRTLSASTAPAHHNILWSTASEKPANSCARQQPDDFRALRRASLRVERARPGWPAPAAYGAWRHASDDRRSSIRPPAGVRHDHGNSPRRPELRAEPTAVGRVGECAEPCQVLSFVTT